MLNGIWKACKREWSKIIPDLLADWKRQLRLISKKNGQSIGHVYTIHKCLLQI